MAPPYDPLLTKQDRTVVAEANGKGDDSQQRRAIHQHQRRHYHVECPLKSQLDAGQGRRFDVQHRFV